MKFLTFVLALFISINTFASEACRIAVKGNEFYSLVKQQSSSAEQSEATQKLIGYLSTLVENGFLKASHLEKLQASFAEGIFVNPLTQAESKFVTEIEVHWNGLERYLDQELDTTLLSEWVKATLAENSKNQTLRNVVSERASDMLHGFKFIFIPKGKFWSGKNLEDLALARSYESKKKKPEWISKKLSGSGVVQYELLQNFEVTSTLITQAQWLFVMDRFPDHLNKSEDPTVVSPSEGSEHPATAVTVWSMMVFANRLSELVGLKPAYNFEGMNFKGDAAAGTLRPDVNDDGDWFRSIRPQAEDIYQEEGYRLPTRYEQEYLGWRRNRVKEHFSALVKDPKKKKKYIWDKDGPVIPVGGKLPLKTKHGGIFDYMGHVAEAVYHWKSKYDYWSGRDLEHIRQANPQPYYFDPEFRDGGGNFSIFTGVGSTKKLSHGVQHWKVGFRLVRSLPEGSLK